jgi:hypothetical protein
MSVMLLALLLSDSALNASEASEYRLVVEPLTDADERSKSRAWTPGVDSWERGGDECPAFFQRHIDGVGQVRIGPRCQKEEIPYAL